MNFLSRLFRKPVPAAVPVEQLCSLDGSHIPACKCFVKPVAVCNGDFVTCECLSCSDLRLARVRYWSEDYLNRMYANHLRRQERSRRLMNSVEATMLDPEIAHVTKVDPEIAITTQVCEVA